MELFELTAHELSYLLSSKKTSAVEITESVLGRISEVEDKIGSYITICRDEALKRAVEVQKRIENGEAKSPLAGIPMALKDNICTEAIKTTCASKMLSEFIPPYNSFVAQKLNNSDTILLGKLNMDEFSMGGSTESSFFHKTKNPWDFERVPGGSSGGAAASVAAHETIFALGSDTGGSIRQPASFCGVVGMKPTYGTVSRYGLVAFASSLDQIGPLAKDVTDCALIMNAIMGHDDMDSTSLRAFYDDCTKGLINDVKGLRIGIPKEYLSDGINDEVRRAILDAIDVFKSLGAECEEFSLPLNEYAIPAYYIISSAEASSNLARYDGIKYGYRAPKYTDLLDMYNKTRSEGFGTEVKRRIMLGTYALSSGYYEEYYMKALKVRTLIINDFQKAFEKYDIILGPTAPTTAFMFGEKENNPLDMYLGDVYTVAVNVAGLPALTVPCGFDSKNLPIGMQLIGKALDEKLLLRAGYTFEQNTVFHKRKAKG